jgi:hypothetical protein
MVGVAKSWNSCFINRATRGVFPTHVSIEVIIIKKITLPPTTTQRTEDMFGTSTYILRLKKVRMQYISERDCIGDSIPTLSQPMIIGCDRVGIESPIQSPQSWY